MRRFFCAIISLSVPFFLASCGSSSKEVVVKKLIGRYNYFLAIAYRDGKFGPLTEVAAEKPLNTARNTYESYYNGSGIVLDSEFLGLEFKNITLGSGDDEPKIKVEWHEAEKEWREIWVHKETFVETEERWKYKWVDKKTEELASPVVTAKYQMRYTVDAVDGSLKVISAEIKKEEIEKEEGSADRWKTVMGGVGGH